MFCWTENFSFFEKRETTTNIRRHIGNYKSKSFIFHFKMKKYCHRLCLDGRYLFFSSLQFCTNETWLRWSERLLFIRNDNSTEWKKYLFFSLCLLTIGMGQSHSILSVSSISLFFFILIWKFSIDKFNIKFFFFAIASGMINQFSQFLQ